MNTHKRYLLIPDGINPFGYVPQSEQFSQAVVTEFGLLKKGGNDYCYIRYKVGTELIRYDEKAKRWAILCFQNAEKAA